MRRALILKIEEKVAELSGCPMHADETALVGALVALVGHPGVKNSSEVLLWVAMPT